MEETIKRADIYDTINANPNQIFGMTYIKADGTVREATCRLHVQNPKNGTKPGEGTRTGESAEHALKVNNNIKYFDMGKENPDGTKGAFRTAKIDRIIQVRCNGNIYTVVA